MQRVARGPSSAPPQGAAGRVLQDNPQARQFVANAVGLGPVPVRARLFAPCHQGVDCRVIGAGIRTGLRRPAQVKFRVGLQDTQPAAELLSGPDACVP